MVKVDRTPEPPILVLHAQTWTSELEAQIQIAGEFSKVPPRFKNRYNHDDVKSALEIMYGEKCCYCEVQIGVCSYEHIEHRMPKSTFPSRAFTWSNLHWSCQICNMSKGDLWNTGAPILDPATDQPEEHLDFDLDSCNMIPKNNSAQGQTTIEQADLNRRKLVEARKRLKRRVITLFQRMMSMKDKQESDFIRLQLEALTINDPVNGDIAQHSMFVKKLLYDLHGSVDATIG